MPAGATGFFFTRHSCRSQQGIYASFVKSASLRLRTVSEGAGKLSLGVNGGGPTFNAETVVNSALANNPKILFAPNDTEANIILDEASFFQ